MITAWTELDSIFPSQIRALQTRRDGAGNSQAPFDRFNLGTRSGDDLACVQANRLLLQQTAALPSTPRWLRQVHGTQVVIEPDNNEPEGDASVTRSPGHVLAILTADCLPVLFSDTCGAEVAAAHAGWRGLAAGVLEATVTAMHTPAEQVIAWLGPCAGANAYEVGQDVFDAFTSQHLGDADAFHPTRPGHWHVNLHQLATRRLLDCGLLKTNIHRDTGCTIRDAKHYFSYRRDGKTGRQASLIWISQPEP